jgi:mannose-6-phosphate isomerase-like protein (cupin superfamily)
MPRKIPAPTAIKAAGDPPKQIDEFVGKINTKSDQCSVAVMNSPEGWSEPGQRPEFTEITLVLEGMVMVEHRDGEPIEVTANEAVLASPGEWVRYSSPNPGGARYVSICIPAFSPETVHRDES